uniref:DNA excision repair protein ERCC-6 n=2 Tax=Cacopsylla melanoneura TaxID=428564 RepID=A0A8D8WWW5_9HEMI
MGCIEQLEQHIHIDVEQDVPPWNSLQDETEEERAIRLGEITPFGSRLGRKTNIPKLSPPKRTFREKTIKRITKKNKRYVKETLGTGIQDRIHWTSRPGNQPGEEGTINFEEPSGSEYEPTDDEPFSSDEDFEYDYEPPKPKKMKIKREPKSEEEYDSEVDWYSSDEEKRRKKKNYKDKDDGDEALYQRRVRYWEKSRPDAGHFEEFHKFDFFGFKIPTEIWDKLFQYQKVGVQWLYELNETPCGGILGDEMGMGKTIEIIAFLAAVHCSKIRNKHTGIPGLGPSMIVCPVTVMHQWVSEFHKWYPPIRVAVLHGTGSFEGSRTQLMKEMVRSHGIIITSYSSLVQHLEDLMITKWHYVILDEGHTIRNPDSQVTLAAKCLRTPHRIILSGSPMQNKLQELWSLFDFVYPGKLGTLPMFMEYYGDAIIQGGFATASEAQVLVGYKCAKTLKEIISPFMLRRMKKDVMEHLQLPNKSEQVLFCKLSDEQVSHYRGYINSRDVHDILSGKLKIFVGLIKLRKICNHPDLYSGGPKLLKGDREEDIPEEERFGHWSKAGKMIVLSTLLKMWHKQKHRVLLFSQSKQMLGIFEMFLKENNYKYLKMDGTTNIGSRQHLVNKFNADPSYFIMILTTRVGGFGINLTGADRVVIYDPDWNPATDVQARERAWRIGQEKQVTVYRLITAGTIEEKMYHRQIFKQFLANRVLNDPKQRRFFKQNDLMELFTLQDQHSESTETSAIFAGTGSEIKMDKKKKINHFDLKPERPHKVHKSKKKDRHKDAGVLFSKEKIDAMKRLAQKISDKFKSEPPTSTVTSGSLELLQETNKQNEKSKNSKSYEVIGNQDNINTESVTSPNGEKYDPDSKKTDESNRGSTNNNESKEELTSKENENSIEESKSEQNTDESSVPEKHSTEVNTSRIEQCPDSSSPLHENSGSKIKTKKQESEKCTNSRDPRLKEQPSMSNVSIEPSTSRKHAIEQPSTNNEHHTKHKKKKKSKHRDRDSILDGEHVPYLVGKEKPKKEKTEEEVRKKQDDYILEKLFSKANICTAMKHDKIMEEGGSDYVVIEKEAEEIAKKAIEAIQESRKSCHSAAVGIPTWTGSNGSIKIPTLLLDKIKKRKQAMANRQQGTSSSEMFKKAAANSETVLIEQIIDFVSSQGNRVTSQAMVERFRKVENAALFKALLNAVCKLMTDPTRQKFWSLKEEFRDRGGPSTSS